MEHEFKPVAEGWSETFHVKDGEVVARLMHCGCEVHFEIHPEHKHKVIFRDVAREFLRPLFGQFDCLTTKVPLSDEQSRKFVTKFGFQHTWSDKDFDYYMLTALPFGKKEK